MWSIVAQAGPSDEANGVPVKKPCPATFSYFTQSAWMPTPFGATLTALKPRPASASSASVISALVRFCAIPHDEKIFIRYVSPNWSTTLRPDTPDAHRPDEPRPVDAVDAVDAGREVGVRRRDGVRDRRRGDGDGGWRGDWRDV